MASTFYSDAKNQTQSRFTVLRQSQNIGVWVFLTLLTLALLGWGALRIAEEPTTITPQEAASSDDAALGTGLNDSSSERSTGR